MVLLYQESHALSRQTLQSLFDVDRAYVRVFREILEDGKGRAQFTAEDLHLLAVSILFLCAVWDLKRWNLKGYTLDTVIAHLTRLIASGVCHPRPPDASASGEQDGTDDGATTSKCP